MKTGSLKQRLARLESKAAAKENMFPQTILVGAYGDNDHDIVAAGIGGRSIARLAGETIQQLSKRASYALKMQVLFAVYSNGREAD